MICRIWRATAFWFRTVGRKRVALTLLDSGGFARGDALRVGDSLCYVVKVRPGRVDVVNH